AVKARSTPDAVRAHLRRARERLREELERGGGEPARAFALLLSASRPFASTAGSGLSAAIGQAAGVMAIMKVKLLLVAAAVLSARWLLAAELASRRGVAEPPAAGAVAAVPVPHGEARAPGDAPTTRSEVPAPAAEPPLDVHGRLEGVRADVPWTAPLTLRVTG